MMLRPAVLKDRRFKKGPLVEVKRSTLCEVYCGERARRERLACGHVIYADLRPARRRRCYLCQADIVLGLQKTLLALLRRFEDILPLSAGVGGFPIIAKRPSWHTTSCGVDNFRVPGKLSKAAKS